MKFYEAAKYYYTGGMHEPGGGLGFGMNLDFWNNLTDHERAVIDSRMYGRKCCAARGSDGKQWNLPSKIG